MFFTPLRSRALTQSAYPRLRTYFSSSSSNLNPQLCITAASPFSYRVAWRKSVYAGRVVSVPPLHNYLFFFLDLRLLLALLRFDSRCVHFFFFFLLAFWKVGGRGLWQVM
jgi:hypothetical protein